MKTTPLAPPIKVWYKALPKYPKILWPIIEMKFSWRKNILPQPVYALVDSGANFPILHRDVAEVLGFDFRKLGPSKPGGTSASGTYKSWTLPELINADMYGFSFSYAFSVIDNPNLIWPCILGGNSIFQVARLDFQKFRGYFEIRFRQDIH